MAEISVVIPSYNRANLIGETLNSVLSQTLPPDEIIVVDDGSNDDTQSVLASYGDSVRPIRIPNSGELVARNTGLRAARNRLVAFCDSDDLWMADFLDEMSVQWRTTPDLMVCYSDFRLLRDGVLSARSKFEDAPDDFWSGLRMTGRDAGVFHHNIVERLLSFQPFFPSCIMVSREAFLNVGGWDDGVSRMVGCDFATTLRVAAQGPLGVLQRPDGRDTQTRRQLFRRHGEDEPWGRPRSGARIAHPTRTRLYGKCDPRQRSVTSDRSAGQRLFATRLQHSARYLPSAADELPASETKGQACDSGSAAAP